MNIEEIKKLSEIMNSNGLTRLEAVDGDFKIILEKASSYAVQKPPDLSAENQQTMVEVRETVNFNNLVEVRSPIVGVFYSASSPESPPFVSMGCKVRKGDVLCIIEAMKLLNEITAEQDGEIVDICLKNGDIAEYGQVMFKMV